MINFATYPRNEDSKTMKNFNENLLNDEKDIKQRKVI